MALTGALGVLTDALAGELEGDGDFAADGEGAFEADEDIGAGAGAFIAPVPPDDFRSWKSPRPELGSVLPTHAISSTSRDRRDVCIGLAGSVSDD